MPCRAAAAGAGRDRLRFRISEDTHRALVSLAVFITIRNGSGEGFESRLIGGIDPAKVYSFTVPRDYLRRAPRVRFCVTGHDPSLNESKQSCARYRLLKPKKR
jgi:hypothetical protein